MNVIADSSFLIAVAVSSQKYHEACTTLLQVYKRIYLPQPAITEITQFLDDKDGNTAVAGFIERLLSPKYMVEPMTVFDLERVGQLLRKYHDARLDFVDLSIVAVAERLNIQTILTLDHRDFGIVRPRHCDYFTLLPQKSPE